jgi:lysophospholipid hydrolase
MDTWRGRVSSSGGQWQTDGVALNSPPAEGEPEDAFELRDAVVVSIAKSIGLAQPSDAAYDSLGRNSMAASVSALSTPNSPMFPANTRHSRSPFGNVLDMMNASRNDDHMIGGMLREAVMHAQDDDMSSVSASVQDSMANGGDVNRSVLKDLEGNVEIMFFKQGSTLVKEGEKLPGIYYVIDGFLDVSHGDAPMVFGLTAGIYAHSSRRSGDTAILEQYQSRKPECARVELLESKRETVRCCSWVGCARTPSS